MGLWSVKERQPIVKLKLNHLSTVSKLPSSLWTEKQKSVTDTVTQVWISAVLDLALLYVGSNTIEHQCWSYFELRLLFYNPGVEPFTLVITTHNWSPVSQLHQTLDGLEPLHNELFKAWSQTFELHLTCFRSAEFNLDIRMFVDQQLIDQKSTEEDF